MSFDKQHLRHCLLFTFQLKKNPADAKEMICSALGKNAVLYSTCKKWFQRFKSGNLDLEDEERPGRISHAICISPPITLDDTNETSDVLKSLETAFDDPLSSDFVIYVEEKAIHVHKTILNIRSSYFKTMFQNTWKEGNQNAMKHDLFSYTVYKSFLKYLYTGKIDLSSENVVDLLALADSYLETKLKNRCTQILQQEITIETAILFYKAALKYNVKELQESCSKVILNNIKLITEKKDFIELDEKLQNSLLLAAINHYC